MTDRFTVRLAYQRGWQVVDGSAIAHTFETKEDAFQSLVDRGARVHLSWRRTVIAGASVPYDFSAEFQSKYAGRIKKEMHGPSAGKWFWFQGSSRGEVATKDDAIFQVERAYTCLVVKADHPK
ncbi:hypothetical protein EN845_01175 [Mesorhizobium sp. M8A.F.Ca.ET.202.01.1.1]|uniref:hypothetical protein n=1 Tax=Mesorhizobium sp. M8A.F.Ca.ET.202.01.1.1 TaxID=2563967 RepID=UPI001093BFC2|nr:hypothetical protein [Mesorhizobium sp. M8A.F.Ca.ET.202.01.1.1]TGR34622.1 hypothetical protein EN845_01175 [Mesorhizobium sp. M8A.F.Ca.ET.202.01.1.1]TGU41658.1 hypothetical protein EN799_03640 [bacterium M00.F.Ca.ET.156.01.1.1]